MLGWDFAATLVATIVADDGLELAHAGHRVFRAFRSRYSRMIMSCASRSRSTKGSPLTSTATRSMVPPVNRYGGSPG